MDAAGRQERDLSTSDQRKLWAEHMEDEARALDLQQQEAGSTHSPVEGPLPYSADELNQAVAAAVAAERQRCAQIADNWTDETRLMQAFNGSTAAELRAAAAVARAVGDEIRTTTEPARQR
jgi:hypothetical protein